MSRILRRPMFRGGKVESRGTGITSGLDKPKRGLVDEPGGYAGEEFLISQGMFDELRDTGGSRSYTQYKKPIGPPRGGLSGGNIFTRALAKARGIPYVGKFAVPLFGSTASALGTGAGVGIGLGALTDFYAKSTKTPEEYRRLKEMGGPNFNFDETNIDVGDVLEYIDEGGKIGEAPGFFPRGGKKKFFEEKGLDPETGLPVEEDDFEVSGEAAKVSPGETALDALFKQGEKKATARKIEENIDKNNKNDDDKNTEDTAELTVKDYIKMLGGDKARRRDVSDLLAQASASFLGAGGVREGLSEFMQKVAASGPGRLEKIEQAAATLDIKDKIASKRAEEQLKMLLGKADYEAMLKLRMSDPKLKSFETNLEDSAQALNKGYKTIGAIGNAINKKYGSGSFGGEVGDDTNYVEGKFYIQDTGTGEKIVFKIIKGKAVEVHRVR